jgi:PAS domain S-box-containing protein
MNASQGSASPPDGSPFPYRLYFDEMPAYCSVQDSRYRIIDCNRRVREDFGEGIGRYCYEFFKQRTEKCPNCTVEKTFNDGQSYGSEEVLVTPTGEKIPIIVYSRPVKDPAGNIVAVMEMGTDITSVKMLENQLKTSREMYRQLFEVMPCYVTVQDRELNIVRANHRFENDFGRFEGEKCFRVYKHRKEPCLVCPVAMTFEDGATHESEEVVTSKRGEVYNVVIQTTPIRGESGEITHVMEMSNNITRLREMQSQLTSLGLLVGSISHGIKGVLTSLDGGMYFLESGMKNKDQSRIEKGWSALTRNIERIRSMILDMLYYAKEREPVIESVSALKLANDVHAVVRHKAKSLGIGIELDLQDVGDFEVDAKSIHSMLVNILDNAVDACRIDKSKTDHLVNFSLRGNGSDVLFRVVDNGIGMEREAQEKVFTLFFSSKGPEGTGLGLFIAYKIVKKHGGEIEVDSTPRNGTTFNIRIPRKFDPTRDGQ